MKHQHVVFLLLPVVLAGPNDTVDQLRVAFTNVPHADQVTAAEVTIEEGQVPDWISGSLARHACGVFGETGTESDMLNSVSHIFDCIEMGQSYSFHQGSVTFTSQFYDTNMVDIWLKYEQNMNQSSVWWGTVFAEQNRTAMEKEGSNMNKPGKTGVVPAVSWWKAGEEVIAMSEWPSGHSVDIHKMVDLGDFQYEDDDDFLGGFGNQHSPAHEQYGDDGKIWSSAAVHKYDGDIGQNKRVVYTLDPVTKKREVVGEWSFADTNLTLCTGMGEVYPDPNGRLRQIHSMQMTENYVVVAETSYMYDPCVRKFWNDSQAGWEQEFKFEDTVDGNVTIMSKKDGSVVATISVPPMMITHVLGAYEDAESGELRFDVIKYNDARAYTYFTYIDIILNGEEHPENMTEITRYTLNMSPWVLKDITNLVKTPIKQSFEFSNINPTYQSKPYKYAYMTKNLFKLHGAVLKLNVDDGTIIEKELPDGLFPSEPIFVPHPNAVNEDDGLVLMSGIDGGRAKGFLMVYNATTMDVLLHVTAPKLTLFGVHSKFFPFNVGCTEEDCTPETTATTTPETDTTTTTTPENSANPTFSVSVLTSVAFVLLCIM